MATVQLKVDVSLRHIWLIKLINYPLVALGFKPYVPDVCMRLSKPYTAKREEGWPL